MPDQPQGAASPEQSSYSGGNEIIDVAARPSGRQRSFLGLLWATAGTLLVIGAGALLWLYGVPYWQLRSAERELNAFLATATQRERKMIERALDQPWRIHTLNNALKVLNHGTGKRTKEADAFLRVCELRGSPSCAFVRALVPAENETESVVEPRLASLLPVAAARAASGDPEWLFVIGQVHSNREGANANATLGSQFRREAVAKDPARFGFVAARQALYDRQPDIAGAVEMAKAALNARGRNGEAWYEYGDILNGAAHRAFDEGLRALHQDLTEQRDRAYASAAELGDPRGMWENALRLNGNDDQGSVLWLERAASSRNSHALGAVAGLRPPGEIDSALLKAWQAARDGRPDDLLADIDSDFKSGVCFFLPERDRARRAAWCTSSLMALADESSGIRELRAAIDEAARGELPASLPNPYRAVAAPQIAQSATSGVTAPTPWKLDDGRNDPRDGLSTFTVDNGKGDASFTVRLYRDGRAVRTFRVDAGKSAMARSLAPGTYLMRYRDESTGKVYEAREDFQLSETRKAAGIEHSQVRVTLYRVAGGNMHTQEVPADRF